MAFPLSMVVLVSMLKDAFENYKRHVNDKKENEINKTSQYDPETGRFTQMSPTAKKQYESDVEIFYKAFSGSLEPIPKTAGGEPVITTMGQVPLRNFHSRRGCMASVESDGRRGTAYFRKPYVGVIDQTVRNQGTFRAYAEHLRNMIARSDAWQKKLMGILGKVFVKEQDRGSGASRIP